MKTIFTRGKSRTGFALIALMAALVVILIVFAGVMVWVVSNGTQVQSNETFVNSEAAAEGATEMIFAQMDRDYLYQSLNSASVYQALTPSVSSWPVQYTFNVTVTEGAQSTVLQYLGNQYTNLMGEPATNTITVTATPSGQLRNAPATVVQTIVFASVPAFQFAIFYNIDLDMSPGSAMTVNGSTFCNHNIWCYPSGQMTFNGPVEAAGNYLFAWDTNGDQASNISSSPATPNFNQGTPLSHANPLVIPIGASSPTNNSSTNVLAIIDIPPAGAIAPQSIAYTSTNQVYDFNAASLIISNASTGVNATRPTGNPFTIYFQDSFQNPTFTESNSSGWHWVQLTNDYYLYSNQVGKVYTCLSTNWVPGFNFNNVGSIRWVGNPAGTNTVFYAGFSFLTNTLYYDYRESDSLQAMQIDVSKFRLWLLNTNVTGGAIWSGYLANDVGHGINSIYAFNDTPFSSSQLPAISMINGALLPNSTNVIFGTNCVTSGLTVATPMPLYVIGNYNVQIDGMVTTVAGTHNTGPTYPAGFLADAITILSSSWPSDWSQSSYGNRNAANTTVNAACLEGIVPSSGGGSGSKAHYSGGIENFIRLLEDWGGCTNTYNGSIMVMFPSQYATNYWQGPGNYYGIPTRNWGFDTNYLIQADLPPLTPQFRTVIRNTWVGN